MRPMSDAKQVLDQQFLEMRWRCLTLAADLDRVSRAQGGADVLRSDPRLRRLSQAVELLLNETVTDRAEKVQLIFSDRSDLS